ncbi:hypothetical protein BCR34DRAFT_593817 [Clohesyomyces aquaticus]|uniref:Zn(2)-C6 fungal-type domain-containing protein n=1 Tax=Clohesyomyces aquaticus TaxID=1231657 RepID=A0A1Y1YF19_9PLEO|nr:hypothetical protein BCR34DRAFT_593817 [Clohesyomyces aquaticus]
MDRRTPDLAGDNRSEPPASLSGAKFRRTSTACPRCRRLRSKCVQEERKLPCGPCRRSSEIEAQFCAFPTRGDDKDRRFRFKTIWQDLDRQQPDEDSRHYRASSSRTAEPESESAQVTLSPLTARKTESYSAPNLCSLLPPYDALSKAALYFSALVCS